MSILDHTNPLDFIIGSISSATRDWPLLPGAKFMYTWLNRPEKPARPFPPCHCREADDYEARERIRRLLPPL